MLDTLITQATFDYKKGSRNRFFVYRKDTSLNILLTLRSGQEITHPRTTHGFPDRVWKLLVDRSGNTFRERPLIAGKKKRSNQFGIESIQKSLGTLHPTVPPESDTTRTNARFKD
ncbi:hypothetical protein JTE90_001201 [Oedothorax gibbosus]|uniref:Uncharacterized protein n=1 Tax=Oedothorax gibbosus TaxID=931172 RepID=A0AAV6UU27_9ARAC|nr:hypothetical protein JTE90_001201 [Oedothorax gibbosus]